MTSRTDSRGFTLVELLVVIGIIAVLISILLPAVTTAKNYAREVKASSGLRQLLLAYTQYSLDHKGALMFGYPPVTVNGGLIVAVKRDGSLASSVEAQRYPWRLIRYVDNVWPIMYYYARESPSDYTKSLYVGFGINSYYMGGDQGFGSGFLSASNNAPNIGKHVMFKATDVRSPSRQIVFTEVQQTIAVSDDFNGFHTVFPPRGNSPAASKRWWNVSPDGKTVLRQTNVIGGLPNGRFNKGTLVGFFDSHVAKLTPRELDDITLWNTRATSPDYDFVP